MTLEDKTITKTAFKVGGKVEMKDEVKSRSLVYVDEIIENPMNSRLPTKLNRTFEKAVVAKDGQRLNLPVEGKTVLIEKKGEKYSFTQNGKAVTGDTLRILEDEFNRSGRGEVRDIMFPKKPVKPGDRGRSMARNWRRRSASKAPPSPRAESKPRGP